MPDDAELISNTALGLVVPIPTCATLYVDTVSSIITNQNLEEIIWTNYVKSH